VFPTVDLGSLGFSVPFNDAVGAAADAGFRACEFPIVSIGGLGHEAFPAALAQFSCGLGTPSDVLVEEQVFRRRLPGWLRACEYARTLGCARGSLLMRGGALSTDWEVATDRLKLLAEAAATVGTSISLEVTDPEWIEPVAAAIRRSGLSNVGLLVDLYSVSTSPSPKALLGSVGPLVEWVHIADAAIIEDRRARVLPGDGSLALESLLDTLAYAGYDGHVSVEVDAERLLPSLSASARARAAWRSLACGKLRRFFASDMKDTG
jgi:sugar phosphate isomerase/epimerase